MARDQAAQRVRALVVRGDGDQLAARHRHHVADLLLLQPVPQSRVLSVHLMGTWQVTATGSPGANPLRWRWRDLRPQINACPEPSTWMPWRREAGSGWVAGAG